MLGGTGFLLEQADGDASDATNQVVWVGIGKAHTGQTFMNLNRLKYTHPAIVKYLLRRERKGWIQATEA